MNNLLLEIQNGIALLTINRPKSLNALNSETLSELDTCLSEIEKRDDVRVVILTGSGEKSFVAGADISEMVNATPVEGSAMGQLAHGASLYGSSIYHFGNICAGNKGFFTGTGQNHHPYIVAFFDF